MGNRAILSSLLVSDESDSAADIIMKSLSIIP